MGKQPDMSRIYTEFGHPGRSTVNNKNQKSDTFAPPNSSKVFVPSLYANLAEFPYDPAEYQKAMCNHTSTVILSVIIDLYMPMHITTDILPSAALKLHQ
ncbi:hypothetical protein CI102_4029 [Trichoderma harzianum]|nr:hypothetical protein CI102_4029 [Trichoderma harzianum]